MAKNISKIKIGYKEVKKKKCQIRDLRQKLPLGVKFHQDPRKLIKIREKLRRTINTIHRERNITKSTNGILRKKIHKFIVMT